MGRLSGELREKQIFLERYEKHLKYVIEAERELSLMRDKQTSIGSKADGMPRRIGWHNDLSDYAAALDAKERELREKQKHLGRIRQEIDAAVKTIGDPDRERVIKLRYLEGLSWKEVSVELGRTERRILGYHTEALERMKLELSVLCVGEISYDFI